jgi:hypothetical protein
MDSQKFEVTATLAAYGSAVRNDLIVGLAGRIAADALTPSDALEAAHRQPLAAGIATLEEWQSHPDAEGAVARRVELQEEFDAYERRTRLLQSPFGSSLLARVVYRPNHGGEAIAFRTSSPQRTPVVLKMPFSRQKYESQETACDVNACFTERRLETLLPVNSPNIEQAHAASYAGAIVTARIPGIQVSRLRPAQLEQISDRQLLAAVDTAVVAGRAGVQLSGSALNAHYDQHVGFGFFDPVSRIDSTADAITNNIYSVARIIGQTYPYAPNEATSAACRTLRSACIGRLRELAPQAPPEAAIVLSRLSLKQGTVDVGW